MAFISSGFNKSLFHISDPNKTYISSENKNTLIKICQDIRRGEKLFLLTGERGSGKKTLIRRVISNIGSDAQLVSIKREILNSEDLMDFECLVEYLANDLDIIFPSGLSLREKIVLFKNTLQKKAIGYIVVVVNQPFCFRQKMIEEALLQLDSEFEGACSCHLMITAMPAYSKKLLESGALISELNEAMMYQIELLSDDEVRTYIEFHLRRLEEQGKNIFLEEAINRIVFHSKGIPGLINRLCSLGLLNANIEEKSKVSLEMIDAVLENKLFLGEEKNSTPIQTVQQAIPVVAPFEDQEVLAEGSNASQGKHAGFMVPIDSTGQVVVVGTREEGMMSEKKPSRWTALSRAFVMGMIVSFIVGAGMYFFQQANEFSVEQENIVEVSQLQQKEKLTQQLIEARLNRLEQQVGKQLVAVESGPEKSGLQLGSAQSSSTEKKDLIKKVSNVKLVTSDGTINNKPIIVDGSENKIDGLLVIAERRLKYKKLMYPVKESALAAYQEVLSLAPGHQQALLGIDKIKETYLRWARYAIKKGKNENALILFRKALKVSPDDPDILLMLKNIQNVESADISGGEVSLKMDLDQLLDDKEEGINKLLDFAKQQVRNKNLTPPENSSAFAIYRAILDRFPMHKEAWLGIKKIKNKYINWARFEMKQGDLSHAKYLYSKALELAPADAEIMYALEQFKE